MEPSIVTIKQHNDNQNMIYLHKDYCSNLTKGDIITVTYGLEKTQAIYQPIKQKNILALSSNIWRKLSFPFEHKIHVAADGKTIHLGPLVGMMTTGIKNHPYFPMGKRTGFYKKYIATQKDIPASFFVFSPYDIFPNEKKLFGYFLVPSNGKYIWKRFLVPYPSAVYNRVFRIGEKMAFVNRGRRYLEKAGTKIFNPSTFNKWNIHELISHRSEIQEYIPESYINPDMRRIMYLLDKYKMIYLKPAEGFLGLGIIQLIKQNDHKILCRFNKGGRNQLRLYPSLQSIKHSLFKNSNTLKKYIAQQGIRLIHYQGRSIDLRVHANKNRYGEWELTGVAAKMAGRGSVTTHVRTGGNVLSYQKVIRSFFPADKVNRVNQKLRTAILTLAQTIDDSLPGYVGDLGFDIGIDQQGNPWMFEANSQPGRHVFEHPSMKESEFLTRKAIIDYALYLSGFTQQGSVVNAK